MFFFSSCCFCRFLFTFTTAPSAWTLWCCARSSLATCVHFLSSVFLPCCRSCCNQLTLYRLNKYRKQAEAGRKKKKRRGVGAWAMAWLDTFVRWFLPAGVEWFSGRQLRQVMLLLCTAVLCGGGTSMVALLGFKVHCILIGTYATHYAADLNCKLC